MIAPFMSHNQFVQHPVDLGETHLDVHYAASEANCVLYSNQRQEQLGYNGVVNCKTLGYMCV